MSEPVALATAVTPPDFLTAEPRALNGRYDGNIVKITLTDFPDEGAFEAYKAWYVSLYDFFQHEHKHKCCLMFDLRRIELDVAKIKAMVPRKMRLTEKLKPRTLRTVTCSIILLPEPSNLLLRLALTVIKGFVTWNADPRVPRYIATSEEEADKYLAEHLEGAPFAVVDDGSSEDDGSSDDDSSSDDSSSDGSSDDDVD